jgi:hypothetical protein
MNRCAPEAVAFVDECAVRLRRANWSAGEVRLLSGAWLVSATNGENVIHGRGGTQAEAWQRTCQAARAVRMLRG